MRYFVTDTDREIHIADAVVVTTRYELENELAKKNVPVHCVNEIPAFRGYESIEKQIGELINQYIGQIMETDEHKILWNVIPDASDGILGTAYRIAIMAVDNWMELLKQRPEEIVLHISASNRIFCTIGNLAAKKQGIPVRIMYASWIEKLKGIKPKYTYLQKANQDFTWHQDILKMTCQSRLKQPGKRGGALSVWDCDCI